MENQGEIILYQPDKEVKLEVRLENETVWLSIDEMSQLFGRDISVIGKHIRNIFKEGELVKDSVWAKFAYTASDGKVYQVDYYNLDVIISHFFNNGLYWHFRILQIVCCQTASFFLQNFTEWFTHIGADPAA